MKRLGRNSNLSLASVLTGNGALQGIRHRSTALLEANRTFLPTWRFFFFFPEMPDTIFLNDVCLNVTEWSSCVFLRNNYSNNLMNMVMSVPWLFVGKDRRKAAQCIPREVMWDGDYWWLGMVIIIENLVSCHKLSLVRRHNYQQSRVLNIKNCLDSCCKADITRHCQQTGWPEIQMEADVLGHLGENKCRLSAQIFSVGELNMAYACSIVF